MEREMEQQGGPYEVTERPDVGDLVQIQETDFKEDRLIFYTELTDDLVARLFKLKTTMYKGRQWHWAAFWRKLEESGYEWTDYMPMDTAGRELISLSRANTWLSVHDKFPVDTRIYANLVYSHYEAVRSLNSPGAHEILQAANKNCITVAELGEVVKGMKGDPPKPKKPKAITCKHCNRPAFEDIPCTGCMLDVAEKRIDELRTHIKAIRDLKDEEKETTSIQFLCERALTVI